MKRMALSVGLAASFGLAVMGQSRAVTHIDSQKVEAALSGSGRTAVDKKRSLTSS